jgi:glycosyltransferase involved in cell wall biosynthesis
VFARIYRVVDLVITHSRTTARELGIKWAVRSERIAVTGHGDYALFATPTASRAEARRALSLPLVGPMALFFGSLRPSKGLKQLLDAWPQVEARVPGAVLVVAGRPYKRVDEAELVRRADLAGVKSSVHFRFGDVDPQQANAFFAASNVVALPYHSITTSGVLRYAYSAARAVVATAVGEHREWVMQNHTGWLVPLHDVAALAESLAEALAHPELADRFGQNALSLARKRFDWISIARLTLDAYRTIPAISRFATP